MKGWIEAKDATAFTRYYQFLDGEICKVQTGSCFPTDALYWKRGKPEPDDDRWLPASAAIAEWGEQGGSKGWWVMYRDEPIYECTAGGTCFEFDTFLLPAGKPPLPKEQQEEQFESNLVLGAGWVKCKICLSSMPEANAKTHVCGHAHITDTGPRMVPVCMIPLSTHRKRLEELADTACTYVRRVKLNQATQQTAFEEIGKALARLLEVE